VPVDLRYDREKKILYATVNEKLLQNEIANVFEEITNSDDYPPDVAVLWDARTMNVLSANRQYEIDLIKTRKKFPARGKSKVAIIVSSDLSFGLMRMYEMDTGDLPQNIMVFRNYNEGEQWLLGR